MPNDLGEKVEQAVVDKAESEVKQQAAQVVIDKVKSGLANAAQNGVDPRLVVGLAVVGGVVAGIAYADLKWHQRAEKKHMEEVNFVESNHGTYLRDIKVAADRTITLPDLFTRENGILHAQGDYKSIADLRAMVNEIPSVAMPPKCADAVTRAMRKLLEFYEDRLKRFWPWRRGNEGDVTSAYLRSMICRLYEHGKNFQGTEYTSAVLTAIKGSLIHFSMGHGENHERRIYLDLACRSLKKAIDALQQHKKERTLIELIDEASPECDLSAQESLKILTKLTLKTEHWGHVDACADPTLLASGIVKAQVPNGALGTHAKAILLEQAPIAQNIKRIAHNYYVNELQVVKSDASQDAILNLQQLEIDAPEKNELNLAIFTRKKKLGPFSWGQRISNFMTTTSQRLKGNTESGETVALTIESHRDLITQRMSVLNRLATLGNDTVLIINLFRKLSEYSKKEIDRLLANPSDNPEVIKTQNIHYMLDTLIVLGADVRKQADLLEADLKTIEDDHEKKTLVPEQGALFLQMKRVIAEIKHDIGDSVKEIKNYRTETHYEHVKDEVNTEEHETLQLFAAVVQDRNLELPIRNKKAALVVEPLEDKYAAANRNGLLVTAPSMLPADPLRLKPASTPSDQSVVLEEKVTDMVMPNDISFRQLDHMISDIRSRIVALRQTESIRFYDTICSALEAVRQKAAELHILKDAAQHVRADLAAGLTYALSQRVLTFLQLESRAHGEKSHVTQFVSDINAMINDPSNHFMHDARGTVDRYLLDHGCAPKTDTYKKFLAVNEACQTFSKAKHVLLNSSRPVATTNQLVEKLLPASASSSASVPDVTFRQVDKLLNQIEQRITVIGQKEELNASYKEIHAKLMNVRHKAAMLNAERDPERRERAAYALDGVRRVSDDVFKFLSLSKAERHNATKLRAFAEEMDEDLHEQWSDFMDDHHGRFGKFMSKHRQGCLGLFAPDTKTRKEFDEVVRVCYALR